MEELISRFLSSSTIAVVGASQDPAKYGHKCYACLLTRGRLAFPVNPGAVTVLGNPAYARVSDIPEALDAAVVITPPPVTERVMDDLIRAGVRLVWLQPGAESAAAIQKAQAAGAGVIHGGPCMLVEFGCF